MEWLIKSDQTSWCVIHGLPRIAPWCSRHMMNIETVSSLWFSTVRIEYMMWVIDFETIWSSYPSTDFNQFNFTWVIWSFSHIWSANLSLIKTYSVTPVSIRNFKCKLEELLTTVSSVSRSFWAQTSNKFWTKKTRKILNDASDFIAFSIKHEDFLKYSDHLLRNHHHHCLKILTGELIVKPELNLLNLSWFVGLRLCTVFTEMAWLITSPTFIRMCWNSSSAKLMVGRVILNRFWWPSSVGASNRWSRGLLIDSLAMPLTASDVRCHIIITLI